LSNYIFKNRNLNYFHLFVKKYKVYFKYVL